MRKSFFLIALILVSTLQTQACEEYILSTENTLSKIKVENQDILSVKPIVTIDNSKNTLFITPIKKGQTSFSFIKNGNEKVTIDVNIEEEKTTFSKEDGFDIISFDAPPVILDYLLDEPPVIKTEPKTDSINIDGVIIDTKTIDKEEGR